MPYLICHAATLKDSCDWDLYNEDYGDFDMDNLRPIIKGQSTTEDLKNFYKKAFVSDRDHIEDFPDVFANGGFPGLVSKIIKDKLEELEPGVHVFLPVEVMSRKKEVVTYYFIYTENKISSVVYDQTEFRMGIGYAAAEESGFTPDLTFHDDKFCTLKKDVCEKNHLWRSPDNENKFNFFCSDAFGEFFIENDMTGWSLKYCSVENVLPDNSKGMFSTKTECLNAVSKNGLEYGRVPEHLRTYQICWAAYRSFGCSLESIPEHLRTPEICKIAMADDGKALKYVPEASRNNEVYLEAVNNNGDALMFIPADERSPKLCLAAVTDDGLVLKHVPDQLRTEEICFAAVTSAGSALEYVPEQHKTAEVCKAAVKSFYAAIQYVPDSLKTPEIYEITQESHKSLSKSIEWMFNKKSFAQVLSKLGKKKDT